MNLFSWKSAEWLVITYSTEEILALAYLSDRLMGKAEQVKDAFWGQWSMRETDLRILAIELSSIARGTWRP